MLMAFGLMALLNHPSSLITQPKDTAWKYPQRLSGL